jgi:hypothetical protein
VSIAASAALTAAIARILGSAQQCEWGNASRSPPLQEAATIAAAFVVLAQAIASVVTYPLEVKRVECEIDAQPRTSTDLSPILSALVGVPALVPRLFARARQLRVRDAKRNVMSVAGTLATVYVAHRSRLVRIVARDLAFVAVQVFFLVRRRHNGPFFAGDQAQGVETALIGTAMAAVLSHPFDTSFTRHCARATVAVEARTRLDAKEDNAAAGDIVPSVWAGLVPRIVGLVLAGLVLHMVSQALFQVLEVPRALEVSSSPLLAPVFHRILAVRFQQVSVRW